MRDREIERKEVRDREGGERSKRMNMFSRSMCNIMGRDTDGHSVHSYSSEL